jgi:hypothetical protein
MIHSRNSRLDTADLERRIDEELSRDPDAGSNDRLTRLAAAVHARTIESQLERAEERSTPRTVWPEELRIPFVSTSPLLRRLILKLMSLGFRDQHMVNAALIRSQREVLALVKTLLDRIEVLEARLEAERAAARAQRMTDRKAEET